MIGPLTNREGYFSSLHDDTPDVPTADELFGDEALEQLRCNQELATTVEKLRAREASIVEQTKAATQDELLRAYAGLVDDILSGAGIGLPATAYVDTAAIFDAVTSLPVIATTAHARRKAREVARIAMLADESILQMPKRAGDFRGLWEQAMRREPRWSADYPSSSFRTGTVVLRGSWPDSVVVHKCMGADEVPAWLDRLISFLSDDRFALELRAACGLGLLGWIHPFNDGNGHTDRLLMIAMLSSGYSKPTLVSLAHELVVNRATTTQQFKQLRERTADATGFCLGMLGQLRDAQQRALNMLV